MGVEPKIPSLKLTARLHLKIGRNPIGNDCIPTIHFQGRAVSFREGNGTPKSSILIGFSTIFTIHFGVPLFLETPIYCIRIYLGVFADNIKGFVCIHWFFFGNRIEINFLRCETVEDQKKQ